MDLDLQKCHQFACCDHPSSEYFRELSTVHMLCHALHLFDWDFEALKRYFEENADYETVFDLNETATDPKQHQKDLLLALLRSGTWELNLERTRTIVQTFEVHRNEIRNHPRLNEILSAHLESEFMNDFLVRLILVISKHETFSTHIDMAMNDAQTERDEMEQSRARLLGVVREPNKVHCVVDPYSAMLKLSCVPTIEVCLVDGKVYWVVTRPVPAGTKLTFSTVDFLAPKSYRQQFLQSMHITCNCIACEQNWYSMETPEEFFQRYPTVDRLHQTLMQLRPFPRFTALKSLMNQMSIESLTHPKFYLYFHHFICCINHLKYPALFQAY